MMSAEENIGLIVEKMDEMGTAAEESGGKVKESLDFMNLQLSGQMISDFGEKLVGFFGEAISSAADFDQQITNTAASLNSNLPNGIRLSSGQIKAMTDEALKLGSTGFFSANQIGEAMNVMAKQGINYTQIMSGGIQTVSQVAAANQEDLGQTANVVSDIIHEMSGELSHEFGGSMQKQLSGVGDAMTAAMHHARLSMEDFLNTMKYVGPQASVAGIGVKEVSAGIALLGEHGIKGSQAGTALRRMLTNLTPASKAAADMMNQLGMTTKDGGNIFYDSSGKMKPLVQVQQLLHDKLATLTPQMQQLALKTIFGQYALSGMTVVAGEAPAKFQELVAAMGKTGVTSELVAEKSKGWGMQIQALQAHYATFMKQIGETLKPVIEPLIGVLNRLMDAWQSLSPGIRTFIAMALLAVGALAVIGGAVLTLIGTIGIFATSWESGVGVLATIATPVGIVVAVLAGIVIAVIAVKKAWDMNLGGVQQKTAAVWDWVQNAFKSAMTFIGSTVQAGVNVITKWWNTIAPDFKKLINEVKTVITAFAPLWKADWNNIKIALQLAWTAMKTLVTTTMNIILAVIKAAWATIKGVFSGAFQVISGLFQVFVHLFTGQWTKLGADVERILRGAVTILMSIFRGFDSAASGIMRALANGLKTIFEASLNAIKAIWSNVWNAMKSLFSSLVSALISAAESLWSHITSAFSSGASKAASFVAKMASGIISTLSALPGQALQWGENMMNMFISGITSKIGAIGSAISGVAGKIKSFLGFHSPTEDGPASESDVWMPNMMKMFTSGIEDHTPHLQAAIGKVAMGLQTSFSQTHQNVQNIVANPAANLPVSNNSSNHVTQVIINIDGRSAKTDNELAERIATKFRAQMPMVTAR
jgi:TP901 family phage tail tape measure protein